MPCEMLPTFGTRKKNRPIPNITALRTELDYGHNHCARDIDFYRAVKTYVSSYKTISGIAGETFHQKRDPVHQGGLGEMTQDFLYRDGNGVRYWPDDDNSVNHGKLRFSKDSARIKRAMKDLFFRINQQRYWGRQGSNSQPDSQIGASIDRPVDLDGFPDDLPDSRAMNSCQQGGALPPTWLAKQVQLDPHVADEDFERSTFQFVPSVVDILGDFGDDTNDNNMAAADLYNVPSSPVAPSSEIPSKGKRPAQLVASEDSAPSKRAKNRNDDAVSSARSSPASVHIVTEAPVGDNPGLPSTRVRKRREFPDMVRHEDMDLTDSDAIETVESDIIQSPPTSQHPAPTTVMHEQGTVGNGGGESEETTQESSRTMLPPPPPSPEPAPSGTPLYAFLQSNVRAESQPVSEPDIPLRVEQALRKRLAKKHRATYRRPQVDSEDSEQEAPSSLVLQPTGTPTAAPLSTISQDEVPEPKVPRSLVPPSPIPAPVLDTCIHRESEDSSEPKSDPKPSNTPKIDLKFSVQISRGICKLWDMKGTFQQKTLGQLVDEFNIAESFTGFSFFLETPNNSFDDKVDLGNENGFQAIKQRFQRKIRDVRRSHRGQGSGSSPAFEITIVPLWVDEPEDEEDVY